ncbi:acyltransferase family protein [Wenyingzhuangia sp. IMCC45574]
MEKKRIKILDSLRGMAALLVLFHHLFKINRERFYNNTSQIIFNLLQFLSDLNHEAVMFFFVLSGFSIGLSLNKRNLLSFESVDFYYFRRIKRILPLYLITLIFTLILGKLSNLVQNEDYSLNNFIGNLLFLQTGREMEASWFVPYGLNGSLWSLSVEMFFYLFFPIIYLVNYYYLNRLSIYFKYVSYLCVSIAFVIFCKKIFFVPYLLFFASFGTWIFGYLVAQTYLKGRKYHLFFTLVFILGILLEIFKEYIPSKTFLSISGGMIIGAIFYFFIVCRNLVKFSYLQNILNWLFFKIGEGSYAIYVLHYPILLFFDVKKVNLTYQIIFLMPFLYISYLLEKKSILWKLSFLKLPYTSFLLKIKRI